MAAKRKNAALKKVDSTLQRVESVVIIIAACAAALVGGFYAVQFLAGM
jgi:hypothetical protein